MCGRFVQQQPPAAYAGLFGVDPATAPLPNAPPRFNAAPTQDLLAVRRHPQTGDRHLSLLRWGLVPVAAPDASGGARLINARAETVAEKASFRGAWQARRLCIVPADGFYEWPAGGGTRQPYLVTRADGAPMALAGLWEGWRDPATGHWLRTFTILTCAADARLAPLHARMPVILEPADVASFLEEADPRALLTPFPGASLAVRAVSTRVNAVRNDEPGLLDTLPPDEAEAAMRRLPAA